MLPKVRKFGGEEFRLVKSFREKEKASRYAVNRRKEGKKARVHMISNMWRVFLNG